MMKGLFAFHLLQRFQIKKGDGFFSALQGIEQETNVTPECSQCFLKTLLEEKEEETISLEETKEDESLFDDNETKLETTSFEEKEEGAISLEEIKEDEPEDDEVEDSEDDEVEEKEEIVEPTTKKFTGEKVVTGIEIHATPPGKRLKGIGMLSGGVGRARDRISRQDDCQRHQRPGIRPRFQPR